MRHTQVSEVSKLSTMKALLLPQETPIEEAIDRYASNTTHDGIFLLGHDQRLSGIVNNADLLDWARLQFDLVPGNVPLPVGKVRRLLGAQTIGDLAVQESWRMAIRQDETLAAALEKMERYNLEDIAVIDEESRIVNDLRLSEILSFALHARQQQRQQP
ncbi:MAG: CBS domain-containing protein [Caldilineaceae bacterium]|nr:CBS domain-containing protein [Caldilineaceae bacterium]